VTQVLEVLTDHLNVHFIDYGNKENVKLRMVERADPDFFSIPPLAERFIVAGLSPANGISWTSLEYELLEKNLLNSEFEVEVLCDGVTGFPPLIRLINADFVSPVSPQLISRWPSLQCAQQFAVNKRYTVFVTHYESVLNFWVQNTHEQQTLDHFHESLASSVDHGRSRCLEANQCWPGTVCVARYKGSDQFFRAVVHDMDWQGLCGVTFIDYGDSDSVSIKDLWPIQERFLSLPVQALRCCASVQSVRFGSDKLRKAFASGCSIYVQISAVLSVHHLVDIDFDDPSAVGQPIVQLPNPVGSVGLPPVSLSASSVPKYVEPNLAEGAWHSVCISSVEPDGSFYCQLLSDAVSLNSLMLELSSMRLLPVKGALVDGMACVVRNPADGHIYRAHVRIVSGLCFVVTLQLLESIVVCSVPQTVSLSFYPTNNTLLMLTTCVEYLKK